MWTIALGTAKFEGCCEEVRQAEPYAGFFCPCLPTLQTSSQVAWPHVHELLALLGSIPACGHDVEVQNYVNNVSAAARLTCWATLFAFSLSLSAFHASRPQALSWLDTPSRWSTVVDHRHPRVSAYREHFSTLHGASVDESDFACWSRTLRGEDGLETQGRQDIRGSPDCSRPFSVRF